MVMAMLMMLMVVLMRKMVMLVALMAGILSLESAKETLVEVYFCFFDGELHVNSDHDGHSAEDEDQNDQFNKKSIRTQRALRFPKWKVSGWCLNFWNGVEREFL